MTQLGSHKGRTKPASKTDSASARGKSKQFRAILPPFFVVEFFVSVFLATAVLVTGPLFYASLSPAARPPLTPWPAATARPGPPKESGQNCTAFYSCCGAQ
jgi:hypothetical protein